jgi:quercetin 2,3-dioxygenase
MTQTRTIRKVIQSKATIEGAGVHLKRAFGFGRENEFDPFLLLDDFRSTQPQFYMKGFPWHPHRGIETITYILDGKVEHGDSLGNSGVIGQGDIQWMTAGNGIIHQEMPKGDEDGIMGGFQLWANLPAAQKMIHPRYRDITQKQIPLVTTPSGVKVRVICGEVSGVRGPVHDIVIAPQYLDVSIPANAEFIHPIPQGHTAFAYIIEGAGYFDTEKSRLIARENLVLFEDGDQVSIGTDSEPVRFLLISGRPIGEPIAWYGPIVMNTQEELRIAIEELQNDTFIKHNNLSQLCRLGICFVPNGI